MPHRRKLAARRPKGAYTQAHRLIQLYDRLHRGDALSAPALAAELGISRRTIERDLSVLKEVLGDRLDRDPTPDGRVVRRVPSAGRRFNTTAGQVLAVALGTRLSSFLSGRHLQPEVAPLLEQLRQGLTPGDRRRLRGLERKVHIVSPGHKDYTLRHHEQLEVLVDALIFERPVRLSYLSHARRARDGSERDLLVQPLSLVVYRGGVYFVVDLTGGDISGLPPRILLALDRIGRAVSEGGHFDPPDDFRPDVFLIDLLGIMRDAPVRDVRVRVDAPMAPYVSERGWHGSQRILPQDDGAVVVSLRVAGLSEVADWVISLGEHAEVLAPAPLRREVGRRLGAALARYRGAT